MPGLGTGLTATSFCAFRSMSFRYGGSIDKSFWQRERGGQLFAEVAASGDLVLAWATPPHPWDRSSWGWLELDAGRCQAEVIDANRVGHRLVGTWHSHPQRVPHLSPTDRKTLTASARINEGILPASLAVIVGYGSDDVSIRAWRVDGYSVEEGLRSYGSALES